MKLTGPDHFAWMALRRVRHGGLARRDGHYYNQGIPVGGWLIPHLVDGLVEDGLLELGDPDEFGMRRVALTEAGLEQYRVLCKRQRHKNEPGNAAP
ncbi:MAG: hypothetical protein ACRDTG_13120 [Pseudonocardiaceae bacterium]